MKATIMSARQSREGWLAWVALAGALALALLTLALSAPAAQSATERSAATRVTGGQTLLKLDSGTATALTDAGVSVRATGSATGPAGSSVFAFPIVGGKVDTDQLSGRIVHSGGLAFKAGGTRVVVKNFVINLNSGRLTAEVAGAGVRIPLLKIGDVGGVNAAPGVLVLRGVETTLTPTAAGALNQAFDTNLFEGGLPIGKATVIARTAG